MTRKVRLEELTVPYAEEFSKNVWVSCDKLQIGDIPDWNPEYIVVEIAEVWSGKPLRFFHNLPKTMPSVQLYHICSLKVKLFIAKN